MSTSNRNRRAPGSETKPPTHRPPRMAEIRRTRQRVLLTLYVVLGVELCVTLLLSPVFGVKRTRVQGIDSLPPQEAAAILNTVSLRPGTNWFRAPVGSLQQRLNALPWVKTAQVSRRFPDTVRTQITLREPAIIVETSQGAFEVDAQGVAIRSARPVTLAGLPHVVLEGSHPVQTGSVMAGDSLRTAIQIFQAVSNDPVVRIAKIQVDQNDNLCLNMQNGFRIQFGRNEAIETKIKMTRRALKNEPNIAIRLTEINLSCPEAPACTPRVAETTAPPGSGPAPIPETSPPSSIPPGPRDKAVPGQTIL